jgi:exopolysaccharide biosynthesis predicted pyruvyltransferase EpsI
VPLYDRTSDFIRKHHHAAQRITVMPSTIRGNEDLIAKARNVTFYCRDRKSLEYVRSVSATSEAKFAHDMALMLDLDELADNSGGWRSYGFSPRRWNRLVVRPRLASMLFRYRNRLSPNSLSAFRIDSEKTGLAIPKMNLDVSGVLGRSRNFTEVESRMATRNMVRFLSRLTDVSTNRLHVAITAALLGLRVNLFDNSYGKNLAVYESSLSQRFKTMKYCEFGQQDTIRKAA